MCVCRVHVRACVLSFWQGWMVVVGGGGEDDDAAGGCCCTAADVVCSRDVIDG